jgi:hypothetical protein
LLHVDFCRVIGKTAVAEHYAQKSFFGYFFSKVFVNVFAETGKERIRRAATLNIQNILNKMNGKIIFMLIFAVIELPKQGVSKQ